MATPKIVGKYTHIKSENLDNYFKASGVPYIARKMMSATNPTVEISNTEDEWAITTVTMFRTTTYKFRLGDEYEEHMPGIIIKSKTRLEDGKLITVCRSPDGLETTRVYEFTDEGMTITYKQPSLKVEAIRHYKRVM